MNIKTLFKLFSLIVMIILFIGCSRNNNSTKRGKNISQGTGFGINSKDGGFQYDNKYKGQMTGPGLVFVEGGTFTKGNVKDNVMHDWNNTPTQQYVRSFYIDETEVTNLMYLEYLDWMKKVFSDIENLHSIYVAALPDTLVWRNPLGFNEDMVDNYLRHPAFQDHPVVGVSWEQASRYAKWRTDRVNELMLVSKGLLRPEAIQADSLKDGYSFNTDAYYLDPSKAYGGRMNEVAGDKAKETNEDGEEIVSYADRQDGILLPEYRLPTETEWEYAALALSEIRAENIYRGKKKFPWDGEYTRSGKKKNLGDQLANFKLSAGDYGGIAGWSETGSGITTAVRSYPPNDFGLYGMAGNVAEWVADVYRPIIDEAINDFNYYRGSVYTNPSIGDDGKVITIDPDSATFDNLPGSVKEEVVSDSIYRVNYSVGDNRNFNDGDVNSIREYGLEGSVEDSMYDSPTSESQEGTITLINNEARVFKGGSWLDRAYYLDPAQRRFLPQDMTNNFIGFRCAMSYLGESRNAKKPKKR
ncbi:MAG: gliding motility lipoprotein GldJ [Flavobacteriales bacterium]|jgi:gliding motility-associated lipoprotein GldJ